MLTAQGLPVVDIQEHDGGYFYRLDDPTTQTYWPESDLIRALKQPTNGDLAADLAEMGYHVFPCHEEPWSFEKNGTVIKRKAKEPYWHRTDLQNGKDGATTNQDLIRRWWQRWPGALVGINCAASGIFAVDVDTKNDIDGFASWEKLAGGQSVEFGPCQSTPTGGAHFVFRKPGSLTVPNTASKLGAGLDLRSDGYICTGEGYQVWEGFEFTPPATVPYPPDWLSDAIRRMQMQPDQAQDIQAPAKKPAPPGTKKNLPEMRALAYMAKIKSGMTEGQRNENTFRFARFCRDVGLSQSEAERLSVGLAQPPEFTEHEIIRTVASAYSTPPDTARLERQTTPANGKNGNGHHPAAERPLDAAPLTKAGKLPTARDKLVEYVSALNADERDFLLRESIDSAGHAACTAFLSPAIGYCSAYGWMYYNGRYWEAEGAEAKVSQDVITTLKVRQILAAEADADKLVRATYASADNVAGTKNVLKTIARIVIKVDEFDSNPDMLNCQNGLLDLRTGKLWKHNRNQKYTYAIPVDYDPGADRTLWLDFLTDATGNKNIAYLQMALGYSLTGHTIEEVLFYLFGPLRSGKGTFTETILAMLGGKPLSAEVDFSTFTADRMGDTQNFDLAPLKPCRFVAASESQKHARINPAKIKALTGGNHIYCAFKHRDHFEYKPQFKIWLSSNHPVNIDVDDDAAWYRVRVIEFPNSHADQEDKGLKHRLRSPENLSGVLAWAVEGAIAWYGQGYEGLPHPPIVRQATQAQRELQDYVGQFLAEVTTPDPEGWVSNDIFYAEYKTWCDANGVKPFGQKGLTQALNRKGYASNVRWAGDRAKRGVSGLRLAARDVIQLP